MATFSIGSAEVDIFAMIPEAPTSFSGTNLDIYANQAKRLVANWTQTSLSFPVDESYYGPILNIATALALYSKANIGTDMTEVSLGEFRVVKGSNPPEMRIADQLWNIAVKQLAVLGRTIAFRKTNG